jgi:hypothetical protein
MGHLGRSLVLFAAVTVVLAGGFGSAVAQEATPVAGPLAAMGYPTLAIRATAAGFETPSEVPAGRTLITVENVDVADANGFVLLKVAGDVNLADLHTLGEAPAASPAVEEGGATPAWFYTATWLGIGGNLTGKTSHAVVDLTPGTWLVLTYPDATRASHPFTVSGEAVPAKDPTASVTVTLQDYAFVGLESTLPTGPRVWHVSNKGPQPHEIAIMSTPKPLTMSQWLGYLTAGETATPPPDFPLTIDEIQQIQLVAGLTALSAGQTAWVAIDLPPGNYAAICFIDSPQGEFHAAMGMIQPFTVA